MREDEKGAKDVPAAILRLARDSLESDHAIDVIHIDLRGVSPLADDMLIASGRSQRHVGAIADKLVERLKKQAGCLSRVEGRVAQDWVLVDAGSVIVHIFRPEARAYYDLEKMWGPPSVPLARKARAKTGEG